MMQSDPSQRLRLYLIRHGEVEGAEEGRVFGQTDVPLSERGLEQSRRLADRLATAQLSAVYSSDLQRANRAAEMIAHRHGLKLQPDAAWREINMGEWEGRRVAELHQEHNALVEELFTNPSSFTYPGGESYSAFTDRVHLAMDRLLVAHPDGQIALVVHGGVCRTIIGRALEIPMRNWLRLAQNYGCVNMIDWYGANPVLQKLNVESTD
jgi:alpha-ribazole phosphatase/probable phosphoglycerate mutase